MRFRLLFVLFNVVIAALFALVLLMPVFVLGWDYARLFWAGNWQVGVVFLVVVAGLNGYFLRNRGVFALLEKEDWEGLAGLLERRVLEGPMIGRQHLEILIHALLVIGAVDRLRAVEEALEKHRPGLLRRFAVEFGVRYLMAGDPTEMQRYFGRMVSDPKVSSPLWIRLDYAIALRLSGKSDEARGQLATVLQEARDPVLRLLCAYLLDTSPDNPDDVRTLVTAVRGELTARYDRAAWAAATGRRGGELQLVAMRSVVDAATAWAWGNGET